MGFLWIIFGGDRDGAFEAILPQEDFLRLIRDRNDNRDFRIKPQVWMRIEIGAAELRDCDGVFLGSGTSCIPRV